MITYDDLFKYSFVISVDDTRYEWYKKVFTHFGLPLSEKVGFQNSNMPGSMCCGISHTKCIELAKERNYPYCLILEDDAYPCQDIVSKLNFYISKLNKSRIIPKNNIDVLYLGYYSLQHEDIPRCRYFVKPIRQWGSHAYIIFSKFYNAVLTRKSKRIFIKNIDRYYSLKDSLAFRTKELLFEQFIVEPEKTIHKFGVNNKNIFFSETINANVVESDSKYDPERFVKIT